MHNQTRTKHKNPKHNGSNPRIIGKKAFHIGQVQLIEKYRLKGLFLLFNVQAIEKGILSSLLSLN